jgi:hypothetical protein
MVCIHCRVFWLLVLRIYNHWDVLYFQYMHVQEHLALKIPVYFQDIKQGAKNLILYLSKYSSVIGGTIFQN